MGGDVVPPAMRQALAAPAGAHPAGLRLIAVLNSRGDLIFDTAPTARTANFADRDYFIAHAHGANVGAFVSRPFIGRLDGELEIALSRRLSHRDGSFAGIAFGIVKLAALRDLFGATETAPEGSLSLLRTDGIVLMRKPYRDNYIGRDLGSSALFALARSQPAGVVEGSASIDGVDRSYAFTHIAGLPLILSTGVATASAFGGVDRRLLVLGLLALLLAGNALWLAARLARAHQGTLSPR